MKNKIIKASLLTIFLVLLTIFGIFNISRNISSAETGNASNTAKPGTLINGEKNPSTYSYKTNFGTWIYSNYTFNPYKHTDGTNTRVPSKSGYQVYCIQPDAHVPYSWDITYDEYYTQLGDENNIKGDCYQDHYDNFYLEDKYSGGKGGYKAHNVDPYGNEITSDWSTGVLYNGESWGHYWTPVKWTVKNTVKLPPALAYIVSNEPIGIWSQDKQGAIWNLGGTDYAGGLVDSTADTTISQSPLTQTSKDYADYDEIVRKDQGLNPQDLTNIDDVTTKVDQENKKYTVGPFNIKYTEENGKNRDGNGGISFSGISNMVVVGYNSEMQVVKDNIEIEKFILVDKATNVDGSAKTPEYFEPDNVSKVDETKQVYPETDQDFQIVFSDPNVGLSVDDPNRVSYITLKVEFKYMLANGEYTYYKGEKHKIIFSHTMTAVDHEHLTCTKSEHTHSSACQGTYWIDHGTYQELVSRTCNKAEHTHTDSCYTDCGPYLCRYSDSSYKCQDLIAADAIRSLYKQELEIGKDTPFDITMNIEGKVWEDEKSGKETLADGERQDSEKPVNNIPVILYDDKDNKVNETTTDEQGKYKFEKLDAMRKYYVEFQYNGQQYENTLYNDKLDDKHSIATETTTDRDALNKKFEEIDGDEGYTIEQLTYEDGKRSAYYNAPSIFTLSAFTGSDGKDNLVKYPKDDKFVIKEVEKTVAGTKYKAVYDKENSIKQMDFGITQRIEFDMALKKDLYIATVKINGKTEVYGYDKRNIGNDDGQAGDTWTISVVGGYERGLDNADWNFSGRNGNTNGLLEVYVTYKIAVRNQSMSMLGHVTKLYDYYDSTYEYQPNLSWQSKTNYRTNKETLEKLQNSIEKDSVSDFGTSPKATDDKNGTLTVDVNKKQETGETQYIYLTFKIKNDENGRVSLGEKINKVEIGAFKTYYKGEKTTLPHYNGQNSYQVSGDEMIAGRVDRDSIPSSMGKGGQPGTNYLGNEDDEDEAPGLNVKLTGDTRVLNGTAWEDERNTNLEYAMIGNGVMDENETRIAGVQVELVEKTVWNSQNPSGEYIWATTTTGEDGKYSFDSYIPGDYVVRFAYSENLSGKNKNGGKSYNGQDYKSTTYQAGITQTETTDLDGKYKGYNDVNNQNETGTYGYNIETKKENVSDAKDIWSVRNNVNQYSNNYGKGVTNGLAEILASPYQTPSYNGNSYTEDEMKALLDELSNNTKMTAETGVVVVEVERNMQSNLENGNPSYQLENINLGLVERAKAQLEIDKSITNIKITLADSTVLFDVNKSGDNVIWKDHTEYNLASKKKNNKYEDYYSDKAKNRYSYRTQVDSIVSKADKGLVQLTMDEELMHGATIEITYQIKVTNVGEVDYEGQRFYYTGDNTSASQVATVANQVVDYVANNLQFNSSDSRNKGWSVIDKTALTSQNLVNSRLTDQINKFNTIIQTEGLGVKLEPGDSTTKTLVLSELITAENTSDDLTYNNMVEIVKTSNTVGRRMAYSVVGNQDPTASKASEVDASMAEKVIILPPFGNTHIYYIIGTIVGIILIGGIAFVIRKVLKK